MSDREFSASIQYEVVKANLEKNNGIIKCEMCGKQLHSINDCHFDHIVPYSKGGKSIKGNCWILCVNCNLSKSNKQLKEFAMENKAKAFLRGVTIGEANPPIRKLAVDKTSKKMTKDRFDAEILRFIKEKGFIDLFNEEIIRDHIWVEDVTEVMYQAMIREDFASGIYNLGGNHPISHRQVAEIVINTMMHEGIIAKGPIDNYISMIDMPEELRGRFQFYTHSANQLSFITEISKGNDVKMAAYVRNLIRYNK